MTVPIATPLFFGVDLGGTNIKIGLVDDAGTVLEKVSVPTDETAGPAVAVERTAAEISRLMARAERPAVAIGLATPGTMDIPAGVLLEPPNLPHWHHFPIRDALAAATNLPVEFVNDGSAAAYGEYWVGSGREMSSMIFLTLGTGVGCGIVLGDTLIHGVNSHGAECGHLVVDYGDSARICGCGQPGHLEAYASATGVVKRTADALRTNPSSLHDRIAAGETLTAKLVAEEGGKGDALARRIVLETAMYLGRGIADLIHTIDPSGVILGGAMTFGGAAAELGRSFLAEIRRVARGKIFPVLAERTRIDFARLGSDAGMVGAAGIARSQQRT